MKQHSNSKYRILWFQKLLKDVMGSVGGVSQGGIFPHYLDNVIKFIH